MAQRFQPIVLSTPRSIWLVVGLLLSTLWGLFALAAIADSDFDDREVMWFNAVVLVVLTVGIVFVALSTTRRWKISPTGILQLSMLRKPVQVSFADCDRLVLNPLTMRLYSAKARIDVPLGWICPNPTAARALHDRLAAWLDPYFDLTPRPITKPASSGWQSICRIAVASVVLGAPVILYYVYVTQKPLIWERFGSITTIVASYMALLTLLVVLGLILGIVKRESPAEFPRRPGVFDPRAESL